MLLLDIVRSFTDKQVPYTLVGGYALALQGIVRATVDIDLVVSLKEKHLVAAEGALKQLGLQSRLPISATDVAHFHNEYRENRNLIAWSFVDYKDFSRQVDLLIFPPLNKVKSESISVHGVKIRVATKKALLEMKLIANRIEDQFDIVKLKEIISAKTN